MPFSLFSSVQISDRIDALRAAEGRLLEYAKTRFASPHQDRTDHKFELFDTPVDAPSVVKRRGRTCGSGREGDDAAPCQVRDESEYSLHGVKVTNEGAAADGPAPLVLLHGYANGSLYFYRNLLGLSRHFGEVYALDLLGWGLSSRPKFDLVAGEGDGADEIDDGGADAAIRGRVSSAESFFVESLESWRKNHNLPKMTLAGHSMGGYLGVAYAERYPQRVERLVLLSPVGIPERSEQDDETRISRLPFTIRTMIRTARYLFEKGITPGSFLRSLPYSRSRAMVDSYIERRLPAIECDEERRHLGDYLYQNSMLPGSGEYCLGEILTPGAFAKIPLVNRIPNLRTEDGDRMQVHMIYGERDWMDWRGGVAAQRACHTRRGDGPASPPEVFVHGVRDAGHLLMLDNYEEFNAAVIAAAGGEGRLPPSAPRAAEFVCDEVAASGAYTSVSNGAVHGEAEAERFFVGGRFNRRESDENDDLEEKKEEQLARS